MIGFFPLLRDVVEDTFALCLACPVGYDFALVGVNVLLRDVVALEFAGVQRVKVLHTMAREFGEGGNSLGHRATFTDNQLVGADIDGLLLAYLIEIPGTQYGCGHGAIVLLVNLSLDEGTFDAEGGWCVKILLAQTANALVHAS